MVVSIVVATDLTGAIGFEGGLPWPNLSEDMKRFRWLTQGEGSGVGGTLIMGRKTYESIGRPLPKRETIVLSSTQSFEGTHAARSFFEALSLAEGLGRPVFIVGGAQVYIEAFKSEKVTRLCITTVCGKFEADTFLDHRGFIPWTKTLQTFQMPNEKNPYAHRYVQYNRC